MPRKPKTFFETIVDDVKKAGDGLAAGLKQTLNQGAPPRFPRPPAPAPRPPRKTARADAGWPRVFNRMDNPGEFARILFVAKACSGGKGRPYASVIRVEPARAGSRLVATDGKRLHVAEIKTRLPPGDYRPALTKDQIRFSPPVPGIQFPDWKKAVPEKTLKRGSIDLSRTGFGGDSKLAERLTCAFNAFTRQTGELVNIRYLEDLPKTEWAVYCQNEKHRAVVLREAGAARETFAVIMPLAA